MKKMCKFELCNDGRDVFINPDEVKIVQRSESYYSDTCIVLKDNSKYTVRGRTDAIVNMIQDAI